MAKRSWDRTCVVCGTPFTSKYRTQRFCCLRHRDRQRKWARDVATTFEKVWVSGKKKKAQQ